ncbi:unnamed protein product [Ostreobium quekettii]|uniref:Sterol 14-demethylase n=1 Tax=Ostreobium quekettii TaxID=121088 RepID=A0A8S1J563_9CHLO|nr:unnamed protein product [Ostreobium quekettii]|eukprot:evm.model.scf_1806.2 EVM.evm.TU.scf_1806.2   scf_1806:23274-25021(-)
MASLLDFEGASVPAGALWLAATVVALLSLAVARLAFNALPSKRPPIFEGIPFIGGLLKFLAPLPLLQQGYAKFGEVFTVPVLHKRITFLNGPYVTSHFFKATDDIISQKEVYGFNVPTFGPGVVYDVDIKVRTEQFRFFAEALKASKLKEYQPLILGETKDFFSAWGETGIEELSSQMGSLVTLTASRTLLGREIREVLFAEVSRLLHDLDAGMLPVSFLFPYLPIQAHRQRDKSRKELGALYKKVIEARRASGAKETDLLQTFIDARYKNNFDGRALTDEEITGLLIAALFAGQHTSSSTASWTGYYLISRKEWWQQAVEEQRQIMAEHGEEITYERVQNMPVLHRVMQEALRLHPPLILILRYVRESFEVTTKAGKTYVIPKGDVVATSPTFTHSLPDLFKEPADFDPDRYLPPREEDQKRPFTYIAFGGGRHGCMGYNFAFIQIKTIWSYLIRNFEFEMVDSFPEPDYEGLVIGPKQSHIRYRRRKL